MEAMSLCEEEVYVELCRMEEPPALEEMRAAVNMREHSAPSLLGMDSLMDALSSSAA